MQNINEDYKNYFKKRLAESILSEAMNPGEPSAEMTAGPPWTNPGFWRGLVGAARGAATRWMWQGRRIPGHVIKSVKGSVGYARQGSGILPFDMWLDDFLHFDQATGQWFRRSSSRGWVHIAENGTTTKIPFDPTQGIPPGWIPGIGGIFFLAPSIEGDITSEEIPGSEGVEATAPYRPA
jgi:hypothetical protein